MTAASFLYITHDGITDHIGQSQIAPYLIGLAERGHRITILSAEKENRQALRAKYLLMFRSRNIEWHVVPYHNRPPIVSTLWVLLRMWMKAVMLVHKNGVTVVHCRSYIPSLIGLRLKRNEEVKFLFDPRDFYPDSLKADKRMNVERNFVHRAIYWFFKRREKEFFGEADHIVSLTDAGKRVVLRWHQSGAMHVVAPITVIPCCADFTVFDRRRLEPAVIDHVRTRLGLAQADFVLIYLGSVDKIYMIDEMLEFFAVLRERRPSAKFLIAANNNQQRVLDAISRSSVDPAAIVVTQSARDEVPYLIAQSDMGILFIRTLGKEASSPTKLAELFAMNVPVVGNTGLGDLDTILDLDVNGSTALARFDRGEYERALNQVLERIDIGRTKIRENSSSFSLETGVNAYDRIYRSLSE